MAAATFPSSPKPKKAKLLSCSPEPEKAGLFPGWVLLDRVGRARCYDDPDAAASAVGDDATAVAVHTNSGQSGYLSFALRAPPLVSYLDLHWPYQPESEFRSAAYPVVLSADENHVLLRIGLENEYRHGPNIFVYTVVGASSPPPSLRRLPACTKAAKSGRFACRKEFMLVDAELGILCRGGGDQDDDYVVADLILSWEGTGAVGDGSFKPSQAIASLGVFSPREGEWTVKGMLTPQCDSEFPVLWQCDRVLPFAGRFLCWIDFYSGILLCDLSNDKSPVLCYRPFPGKQFPDEDHLMRGWPEASRSVSVSQGMLRFIDIDKEGGLTITVWNLEIAGNNSFTWEMQNVINLSGLWAQQGYQVEHLPCRAPESPALAKNDPDVLCCILREHERQPGKVWIIVIDMKHATFRSCLRYFNELFVCCNKDLDRDIESFFPIGPFLPTDFSKYLNSPSGNYS